jgi:hypothetical protein
VSELRADVPKALARMIQRALEKRPEDRHQSASDLRRDLEDLKRDVDTGELRLPGAPRPGPRRVRRRLRSRGETDPAGCRVMGVPGTTPGLPAGHGGRRIDPMAVRAVLLSGALAFCAGVVPGPTLAPAGEKARAEPPTVSLAGRWVYNREASDDARQKMREGMEGRPMGGPGGGMGGRGGALGPPPGGSGDGDAREAMRAIFEPAEELAVSQTSTEIAIDEKFGRTRRLHPDGKKYKTDNGASEVKSAWKEGKLVVETRRDRGTGVVETWELVPDASRIIVSVKMQGGFGPSVTLKRIYDRAKDVR